MCFYVFLFVFYALLCVVMRFYVFVCVVDVVLCVFIYNFAYFCIFLHMFMRFYAFYMFRGNSYSGWRQPLQSDATLTAVGGISYSLMLLLQRLGATLTV